MALVTPLLALSSCVIVFLSCRGNNQVIALRGLRQAAFSLAILGQLRVQLLMDLSNLRSPYSLVWELVR